MSEDKKKLKLLSRKLTAANEFLKSRSDIASRLGKSYGGKRDIYETFGYNKNPEFNDFFQRYLRQDIASALVNIPVEDCWSELPVVEESMVEEETDFEKKLAAIIEKNKAFHYLCRADKLAMIGQFSLLILGFNDGKTLDQPAEKASDLMYLQAIKQSDVQIVTFDLDVKSRRYGLPEKYRVSFSVPSSFGESVSSQSKIVHWTRVIHIVDNPLDNDVFGLYRLSNVLNRLQDLELVSGSGAEMFYRGAFQGLAFIANEDADLDNSAETMEALENEIEEYIHNMKRYLRLQGMSVQQLSPGVSDPRGHVDVLIDLIAGAQRIPKRILLGSERGELASSQDIGSWNKFIAWRRLHHVTPFVITPFIDRLIEVEILPTPSEKYTIVWPDINVLSEQDKASLGETRTRTLASYASSFGADNVVPPKIFLQKYMNMTDDDIKMIESVLGSTLDEAIGVEEEIKEEETKEGEKWHAPVIQ